MKIILLFCFLFVCSPFQSQTIDNDKAHRRYWYYRTRMINDFMKIGKNQGDCIVFAERNIGEDNNNMTGLELESVVGPDQIDITNQYMMALALEYKILSRNNQSTEETIKELYHLLYTLNRLDLEAEQFFDNYLPTSDHIQPTGLLNGFMLREDMPSDYFTANNNENFTHYNYELLENNYPQQSNTLESYNGFTGIQHTNAQSIDSKFKKYFAGGGVGRDELTLVQEKYQSMLIALMFINKYIPDNTYYKITPTTIGTFQDNVNGIKEQAREIAKRCYKYLKDPNGYWNLKLVNSAGVYFSSPAVGAGAYPYAWSLSREACMANRNFPWNQTFANQLYCNSFNDTYSSTAGLLAYNNMALVTTPGFNDVYVTLAYSQVGSNTDLSLTYLPMPICQAMQVNTSSRNLQWADLMRKVLHQDEALYRQLNDYAIPINSAPCQGPYNYGGCLNGGWEWSSQDRHEHQGARGSDCNGVAATGFNGNYPGVDYMLLHNLYYEYQNQLLDGNQGNNSNSPSYNFLSWIYNVTSGVWQSVYGNGGSGSNYALPGYKEAYNYMDNFDQSIWPNTVVHNGVSLIKGTTTSPAKVAVFQNLKSTAHIYPIASPAALYNTTPSDVTYRAGKEISILPGFQVDAGSTFHAYILRYVCTDNSDGLNMRHIQDSATLANAHVMNYESDEMNPIPVHYIESPKSDADKTPVVPIASSIDNTLPLLPDARPFGINEFAIQPNPSMGVFKVLTQKENDAETLSIRIYDMRGQLINSYADVTPEFEIDLSSYSKGIYMVQLMSTSGKVSSKRVDIIE